MEATNVKLIKIDKNGSKHYEGYIPCDRCGGDGVYKWGAMRIERNGMVIPQFAGTCFKCEGAGKILSKWIERTPEYQAKLDAQREKRQANVRAKREAEWAEERKKEAELMAQRLKEKAEREAAEAARRAISQYVGTIGEKITAEVTCEHVATFDVPAYCGYGETTMRVYTFADEKGNKLIWKTSGSLGTWTDDRRIYHPVCEGDKVTIRGTVKGFGAYRGERQTELQRVKLA